MESTHSNDYVSNVSFNTFKVISMLILKLIKLDSFFRLKEFNIEDKFPITEHFRDSYLLISCFRYYPLVVSVRMHFLNSTHYKFCNINNSEMMCY